MNVRATRTYLIAGVGLVLGLIAVVSFALAQTAIHKNSFETRIGWTKGGADAPFVEIAHKIDNRDPHNGQGAEFIDLDVKQGNSIHYVYATGKAPIAEELRVALWVRTNRPGIQLLARVVLPNERDPGNLDFAMTTYIKGDMYQQTGQWQIMEISRPTKAAKDQQVLMNADPKYKRNFDFTGAYIDALVLNLNAGPGPTKVWIDDLEVGPVVSPAPTPMPERIDNNNPSKPNDTTRPAPRNSAVQFSGNRLLVGEQRMLFRAVRYTDTAVAVLRNAGFNTVCFDGNANAAVVKEAADLGMWIVPEFRVSNGNGAALAPEEITQQINRYTDNEALLFWRIGGLLTFEQATPVSHAVQMARAADPTHPIAADVWDGMLPYSRSVNLIGVHRFPLMTTLELDKYHDLLVARRKLAAPDAFTWTWIQTHLPEWYADALYNQSAQTEFKEPVGPQPEQIRLLSYIALASGCRGLAYWSDRFLADSHQGRDRLLCCALINQEMDMMKDLLVTADDAQWVDTSYKDIKAAVLRCNQGVLVIPIWQGKFSQLVPGQAAAAKLHLIVPQVPKTMQAWEVSPGDVRGLKTERVEKGMKVTLPEFGLTSMVVFTSDTNLMGRFQDQARNRRQLAAQWSHDMALYEYEKVLKVHQELEKMGITLSDANGLLKDAQKRLLKSKELWDARNFSEAYHEAERALRPVRILMRAHWEKAVRGLDTPVASPYAVSFYTLPKHYTFMGQKNAATVGVNLLQGGDFEMPPERVQDNWKLSQETLDNVEMAALRVSEMKVPRVKPPEIKTEKEKANEKLIKKDEPKKGPEVPKVETPIEGRQCLMLQIKPRGQLPVPPALERTVIALSSPAVKLPPGTLVQISGYVNIPVAIAASPDGALLYDNVGGDPLAIRMTAATTWKKFTVYRRVPTTGTISVTMALTGIGTVYFDDVRIEPLVPVGGSVVPAGN